MTGYLTRRVRRYTQVEGPEDGSYERDQISIPIAISKSLEEVLKKRIAETPELVHLIPVYNPAYHSNTELVLSLLPPLQDHESMDEDNLRYWVISH